MPVIHFSFIFLKATKTTKHTHIFILFILQWYVFMITKWRDGHIFSVLSFMKDSLIQDVFITINLHTDA